MIGRVGDLAAAIAVVALLAMFVRPGSNGPQLVEGIGAAFVQSVNATIGTSSTSSTTTTRPTSSAAPTGTVFT